MERPFAQGLRDGLPVACAYLAVSFGFGIMCRSAGLGTLAATLISGLNLTSAGQAAGLAVIRAGGTLIEMALTQLVINLRYSLMALSLSQKLTPEFGTFHRLVASFGITDEIFAIAYGRPEKVCPRYLYGMILIAMAGWVGGTFLGATAGDILPQPLTQAMGVLLYAMFIAIVVPPAKKDRGVLFSALLAAAASCLLYYLVPKLSAGFSVIICALSASLLMAVLRPLPEEAEAGEAAAAEQEVSR